MSFLDKAKFKFWDDLGAVISLMGKWEPKGCETEKNYEKSLYAFLHEELEDVQITKQYAQGRLRADLMIGGKVIVELKHDLNTTAKYQRLIGQLTGYKEWKGRIVVLLTGDTDTNLGKELTSFLRREGLGGDPEDAKVTVFRK